MLSDFEVCRSPAAVLTVLISANCKKLAYRIVLNSLWWDRTGYWTHHPKRCVWLKSGYSNLGNFLFAHIYIEAKNVTNDIIYM